LRRELLRADCDPLFLTLVLLGVEAACCASSFGESIGIEKAVVQVGDDVEHGVVEVEVEVVVVAMVVEEEVVVVAMVDFGEVEAFGEVLVLLLPVLLPLPLLLVVVDCRRPSSFSDKLNGNLRPSEDSEMLRLVRCFLSCALLRGTSAIDVVLLVAVEGANANALRERLAVGDALFLSLLDVARGIAPDSSSSSLLDDSLVPPSSSTEIRPGFSHGTRGPPGTT
jgi:hypothetical protein